MQYRHAIDNARLHIRSLWIVITLLSWIIAFAFYGWHHTPERLRVHIPPDLRSGTVQQVGEVPPANVYAFTHYIFQQINRWPNNGEQDYGKRIYSLAAYMTPRFQASLKADLDLRGRRGELAYRTRVVSELPGHGYEERRVDLLGNGVWVVWLDLQIRETVQGMEVKDTVIRYPLRVVRYEVDPESNPWGLALDGFAEEPHRMTEDELKEKRS